MSFSLILAALLPPLAFLHLAASLAQYRVRGLVVVTGLGLGVPLVAVLSVLSQWLNLAADLGLGTERSTAGTLLHIYYLGALPEELIKALAAAMVTVVLRLRRAGDIILAAASVAVGFALVEGLLFGVYGVVGLPGMILRGLTSVPLHAFCGLVMGALMALAIHSRRGTRVGLGFLALVLPTLFHGGFNIVLALPLIQVGEANWLLGGRVFVLLTILMGGLVLIALSLVRHARHATGDRRRRLSDRRLTPMAASHEAMAGSFALIGVVMLGLGSLVALDIIKPPPTGLDAVFGGIRGASYLALMLSLVFLDEARRWWHIRGRDAMAITSGLKPRR